MKKSYLEAGFTLIELLISLSLLAIILCFSISFAPSLYKKNQLCIVSDEIKSAIRFAKLQAVLSGHALALTHLPATSDWSQGMMLVVDNVKHQYAKNVKFLHEWHWNFVGIHVKWQGFQSNDYLLFTSGMNSSALNGNFYIANSLQQQAKLVVNRLGRVKKIVL